jgi:hypothetical protein
MTKREKESQKVRNPKRALRIPTKTAPKKRVKKSIIFASKIRFQSGLIRFQIGLKIITEKSIKPFKIKVQSGKKGKKRVKS